MNIFKTIALFLCMVTPLSLGYAASSSQLTKLEIEAAKQAVSRNFEEAIRLYNQILSVDRSNADVYLQRALLYRELGQDSRSMADAAIALDLLERQFAAGKKKASMYRMRANAHRLLHKFPEAKTDMETAIKLSRSNKWVPDLQAIYLEEKMYANQ